MKSFAIILTAALASTSASAATISGLYNSGVNSGGANWGAGAGATTGNGADPHWTLVGGTAYNGGTNGSYPIGPWLSEDNSSRWLTPTGNAGDGVAAIAYTYRLTFDLTGFNPATASFSGRGAADDGGQLFLNGASIGSIGNFTGWTSFSANSGFIAGVNTLDFVSTNGGGPAGARIEFSASNVGGAVPEPASWALMVGGFGFAGAALRRRRSQVRVTYA